MQPRVLRVIPDPTQVGPFESLALPRYDPRDVFPPDGYGWEPLEPEWDRPGHEWYRSLWRLWAPVPAKRNKRPYGGRRRR